MTKFLRKSMVMGALLAVMGSGAVLAGSDEAIEFRKSTMANMRWNGVAIMNMRKGTLDQEAQLADIAASMALSVKMMKGAFEANTSGHDGKVKTTAKGDLIWQNWEDFSNRLDALQMDADKVAALAASGDAAGAKDAIGAVFKHCKSCHDTYRK